MSISWTNCIAWSTSSCDVSSTKNSHQRHLGDIMLVRCNIMCIVIIIRIVLFSISHVIVIKPRDEILQANASNHAVRIGDLPALSILLVLVVNFFMIVSRLSSITKCWVGPRPTRRSWPPAQPHRVCRQCRQQMQLLCRRSWCNRVCRHPHYQYKFANSHRRSMTNEHCRKVWIRVRSDRYLARE